MLWLIEYLPEASALSALLRGGLIHRSWDIHAHLLASAVDRLGAVWAAAAQQSSRTRVKPPPPLKRPAQRRRPARRLTLAELPRE